MSTRTFGEPIKRNEDRRLLTGQALFIDDVELPGMLHAAFLRSQVAHARILKIDVTRALQRPGVVAAYVAGDLGDYWQPGPILVPPPPIEGIVFHERTQIPLAKDKVRHVGEPLVIVIAESRYIAEDALDDIEVELAQLPAVVDLEKGLRAGSALVHEDVGSNVSAHVRQTKGNYAAAAARADHIIKRRFWYEHGISSPIETRGVVAQWDGRANQMTIWDTTQAPVFVRNGLAGMLGLNERQVRVIAPFVGGGFGPDAAIGREIYRDVKAGDAPKTIEKIEAAGISNLEKLASMTPEQLMEIPGIGEKMVDKIYQAVNRFYEGGDAAATPVETTDETAEETPPAEASAQPVTETGVEASDESPAEAASESKTSATTESASEINSEAAASPDKETPAEQQEEKSS